MNQPPNVGHVTTALVTMLTEQTTRPWGDHQAPGDTRTSPTQPYGIVTILPGQGSFGDVGDPTGMRTGVWQLTGVGPTRASASALVHRALSELFALGPGGYVNAIPLDPEDLFAVIGRRHDASGGVDQKGAVFNAVELIALTLTPAS